VVDFGLLLGPVSEKVDCSPFLSLDPKTLKSEFPFKLLGCFENLSLCSRGDYPTEFRAVRIFLFFWTSPLSTLFANSARSVFWFISSYASLSISSIRSF